MPAKILIADDEPDLELLVRQRFRKHIREKTYDFAFAANGAEALAVLQRDPDIDVILTDINMPVMDGLELLARLQELNALVQPVIVSAYGDLANIRTAMNRGAFDFLTKPIDFNDFEATIAKTLQQAATLKNAARTRAQLDVLERELSIARDIQQSILPRVFPPFPERKDVDIHATMVAARNVGGDLYDFFFIDPHRLGLVVGDVSGKGVPAAIFMAMTRTLLQAVALRGASPGDCLAEVNTNLCRANDSGLFVTLFYGILDTRTGRLEYSNGGHNPPYLLSRGAAPQPVAGSGDTVVGIIEGLSYRTTQITVKPGDALFLYTDGITEAMNRDGQMFSEKRLETALGGADGASAGELVRVAVEAVRVFSDGAPQSDDLTALAVRYLGAG